MRLRRPGSSRPAKTRWSLGWAARLIMAISAGTCRADWAFPLAGTPTGPLENSQRLQAASSSWKRVARSVADASQWPL